MVGWEHRRLPVRNVSNERPSDGNEWKFLLVTFKGKDRNRLALNGIGEDVDKCWSSCVTVICCFLLFYLVSFFGVLDVLWPEDGGGGISISSTESAFVILYVNLGKQITTVTRILSKCFFLFRSGKVHLSLVWKWTWQECVTSFGVCVDLVVVVITVNDIRFKWTSLYNYRCQGWWAL